MSQSTTQEPTQLELALSGPEQRVVSGTSSATATSTATAAAKLPVPAALPVRHALRVIQGGGQRRQEPLDSRDAVVRVLVEAGADLLLRRISVERAELIEKTVNQILELFDRVDDVPPLMPVLQRQLQDLETLMTETRSSRARRQG